MNLDPINPEATFRYTGPFICIDGHAFIFGNPVTVKSRSTIQKLMKRDDFILIEHKSPEPPAEVIVQGPHIVTQDAPDKPKPVITRKRKKATYL